MNLINFSQKKIQQFMKINSKQSVALVDQLKRKMGTGDLSMYDHIAYYSFTSICENAFGVTFNNEEEIKRFLTMSDRHTMLVSARLVPWLNNDFLYSFMPSYNEFTTTAEYLKNFTKQDSGEKRASHVEIEEEMLAILISSIDTTAIVSSFVLLLLSHYQNVQEKLYRE
ncbi:unnamed protein product [Diatraea saccharalis]|uniref:Cytochrome P450 n=1 Tax=Diatraea saccharalis TaxID=40085 RepID=A0A9N9QXP3_9NEOP|nr:unnamed protein product [Diatraea saccharalis]